MDPELFRLGILQVYAMFDYIDIAPADQEYAEDFEETNESAGEEQSCPQCSVCSVCYNTLFTSSSNADARTVSN